MSKATIIKVEQSCDNCKNRLYKWCGWKRVCVDCIEHCNWEWDEKEEGQRTGGTMYYLKEFANTFETVKWLNSCAISRDKIVAILNQQELMPIVTVIYLVEEDNGNG